MHHDLEIDLDDEWWTFAGMISFTPASKAYRVDTCGASGCSIFYARIDDIEPLYRRAEGVGIFNAKEGMTARDRTVRILRAFVTDTPLPAVTVAPDPEYSKFRYRLHCGAHRLHCSLFAGYTHVPAVELPENW